MKLQILSDMHLEMYFDAAVPPEDWALNLPDLGADLLVLDGDIGVGDQGVRWGAREAERLGIPAVYVPGNHEFYLGEHGERLELLREAAAGTPVHVLDRDAVVIDGVRVLGTTLWTSLTAYRPDPDSAAWHSDWDPLKHARAYMNDYRVIRVRDGDGERRLSPHDTVAWHAESVAWLERELARDHDGPTVVVTHHGPAAVCHKPKYGPRLGPEDNPYWSPLEYLFDPDRVDLWVHGHTHVGIDTEVNGVRLVSNPSGYPWQYVAGLGYLPKKLYEVEEGRS